MGLALPRRLRFMFWLSTYERMEPWIFRIPLIEDIRALRWTDLRREFLKDTLPKFISLLLRALDVADTTLRVRFTPMTSQRLIRPFRKKLFLLLTMPFSSAIRVFALRFHN